MNDKMWFAEITIGQMRSFGEAQTVSFKDKDGNPAQWNVILGDNGTGKTTILKALCILSAKANARDQIVKLLESNFKNDHGLILNGIVKRGRENIRLSESFNIQTHRHGGPFIVSSRFSDNWMSLGNDFVLFAYGATRKISNNIHQVTESDPVANLFYEDAALANAESWLIESELSSIKGDNNRYGLIKSTIESLFSGEIRELESKQYFMSRVVKVNTEYGEVRLSELSLGYRTLIAWLVDFIKGLFNVYPDSEDPLGEPAICLIDEIDLHLHPKFQRAIVKFLTKTFPKTQFITTAHSPVIVLASEEKVINTNIILLKKKDNQVVVYNDPLDVNKWSVDQILDSKLFEHTPARSDRLETLREERDNILAKSKISFEDESKLNQIDEEIGFIPFGENEEEIQAEYLIKKLADMIRAEKEKHD